MLDKNIISFDIGELNLSYCLINYNNGIEIIKWEVLDISFKQLYCKSIINKRAICNKLCKYYEIKNSDMIYYCKNHAFEIKKKNKKHGIKKIMVESGLIENIANKLNNLVVRLLNVLKYINKIINDNKLINLEVYIENQLTENNTMKNIAICIFMYFTNLKMENQNIKNVNFINANLKTSEIFLKKILDNFKIYRIDNAEKITYVLENNKKIYNIYNFKINKNTNKLKIIKLFNIIIENIKNNKNIDFKELNGVMKDYDYRKNIVIMMCDLIIKKLKKNINNILNVNKFYLMNKKDDMADCFIYSIIVLIKNNEFDIF
jgi:hypothetical protein